jgi:tetratricopeptide (TPR) repeat protein
MRRLTAGICAFVAGSVVAGCAVKTDTAVLAKRTAEVQLLLDEYYGDRARIEGAGRQLDEILAEHPSHAPAYVQAARLVLKRGRLVNLQFAGGTLERAEQILLKARELDPKYTETHSLLGHVYTLAARYPEAEAALAEADRLGSTNPWTQVNWGHLYEKQGKMSEAQMEWIGVIEAGRTATPQERGAYLGAIGFQRNLLARAGQVVLVKDLGDKATAVAAPHDAWTWGNYSNDLSIAGDFDEAIVKARAALTKMDYGAGRYTLACGLIGKWAGLSAAGNRAEAEKYFAEAAAVYPDLAELTGSFCGGSPTHVAAQKLLRERLGVP